MGERAPPNPVLFLSKRVSEPIRASFRLPLDVAPHRRQLLWPTRMAGM